MLQILLYQAVFVVAFYVFLVGELTAKAANLKGLVQLRDLHFDFKQNFATLTGVLSHGSLGKEFCLVSPFTPLFLR